MKKANSLWMLGGCTVLALIAFAGGYYSGLTRSSVGTGAANERALLDKIAELQREKESARQEHRDSWSKNSSLPLANLPDAALEDKEASKWG